MKLNLLLVLSGLIMLLSCSKDDSSISVPPESVIKLNLQLLSVSNDHDISNIQVGDVLTYKFNIESNIAVGDNYIVPERMSAIKHQRKIDFDLQQNNLVCDTIKCLQNNGEFKILVKKAGNFQNNFKVINFEKKPNSLVTSSIGTDISFNSVRIIAYSYHYNYHITNAGHHWMGFFNKLYIDNGSQQNDKYLQGLSYQIKYLSISSNYANFLINANSDFHPRFNKWGGDLLEGNEAYISNINKITFYTTINNTSAIIEYNNILVNAYGEQPAWGIAGNNNL